MYYKNRLIVTLFSLLTAVPLLLHAQGVKFEENMSWEQIKKKAEAEKKYIFVDVYTTWCGPCKQMEKDVYPNDTVGKFMNDKFISVKVQMDTTAQDNEYIKKWYADARKIGNDYPVSGYPTFLFLLPDGQLIHKGLGYNNASAFVEMARFAFDPKRKEYIPQIQAYKQGKRDYAAMPGLVKTIRDLVGDEKLSKEIAREYKVNYLDKLPKEKFCTKDHLQFIMDNRWLVSSSNDPFYETVAS